MFSKVLLKLEGVNLGEYGDRAAVKISLPSQNAKEHNKEVRNLTLSLRYMKYPLFTLVRCNECRRLNQEYARNTSCDRCRRLKLSHQFSKCSQKKPVSQSHISIQDQESSSGDISESLQIERIKALEYIVKHYTGLEQFSLPDLEMVIADISSDGEFLPKGDENEDDGSNKSANTTSTGR